MMEEKKLVKLDDINGNKNNNNIRDGKRGSREISTTHNIYTTF